LMESGNWPGRERYRHYSFTAGIDSRGILSISMSYRAYCVKNMTWHHLHNRTRRRKHGSQGRTRWPCWEVKARKRTFGQTRLEEAAGA
jgi:hypothetical protein